MLAHGQHFDIKFMILSYFAIAIFMGYKEDFVYTAHRFNYFVENICYKDQSNDNNMWSWLKSKLNMKTKWRKKNRNRITISQAAWTCVATTTTTTINPLIKKNHIVFSSSFANRTNDSIYDIRQTKRRSFMFELFKRNVKNGDLRKEMTNENQARVHILF